MMFLPYKFYNPENCDNHGYRYSMSNCVFESAFEATLDHCNCYPLFHEFDYNSLWNYQLIQLMTNFQQYLSTTWPSWSNSPTCTRSHWWVVKAPIFTVLWASSGRCPMTPTSGSLMLTLARRWSVCSPALTISMTWRPLHQPTLQKRHFSTVKRPACWYWNSLKSANTLKSRISS